MSLLSRTLPLGPSRQQEMMKEATTRAYSTTPQGALHAHFFLPPDFEPGQTRTMIVFLHGGFWDHPMPTQFVPQCLHFASRGAIAVSVETRVGAKHGTGPLEACEDLQSLLQRLKDDAAAVGSEFRLVLAGASGGAWLALQQVLPTTAQPVIEARALVLFSALLDTARPDLVPRFPDRKTARKLSPLRQVRRRLPPMLLCHGKLDRVTPFGDARKFVRALRWRRNRVELLDFERAEHSFFNFNVSELYYDLTLKAADRFLVDQGLLGADELMD